MKIGKKLLALNLALLMVLAILPFGALAANLVPGQPAEYVKTSSNNHEHMTFIPAETGVYTLTVTDGSGNTVRYDLVKDSAAAPTPDPDPDPDPTPVVPGPGTATNLALRPVQSTESEAGVMAVTSTGVNLDLHVVPAYGSISAATDKNALLFAGKTYEFYLADKAGSSNGTYRFRIDRVDVREMRLNEETNLSKDGWLMFKAEKNGDYQFRFATPANLYTLNPAERHHGNQTLKLKAGDVCYIGESGYNTSGTVTRIQDSCDHNWSWWKTENPSCTKGTVEYYSCTICGEERTEESGSPLGHNFVLQNAKDPTCTAAGYTGDEVCTRCGEIHKKGTAIAALGHSWGDWVVTQAATFAKDGVETKTCTRCGLEETRAVSKLNPFVDVIEGKYYFNAVEWAVFHNPQITKGTDATHFEPNKACTRGEVVTFLWRAMGCPEPKNTDCPFTDVSAKRFYYKAVLWAVENNITKGTTDTTFSPNDPCTRGHVVTFLYRAKNAAPVAADNPFTDVKPGKFYSNAVLWAVANGITKGETKTTFEPAKTCTRGQIVTFLQRADKV